MSDPRPSSGESLAAALLKTGTCHFRSEAGLVALATPFYRRELLPFDQAVAGPAVIVQKDSTTVVPPGSSLVAEAGGNMIIQVGDRP
jgi:N-methylhydantoinase A